MDCLLPRLFNYTKEGELKRGKHRRQNFHLILKSYLFAFGFRVSYISLFDFETKPEREKQLNNLNNRPRREESNGIKNKWK